jgi:hypothetical protein
MNFSPIQLTARNFDCQLVFLDQDLLEWTIHAGTSIDDDHDDHNDHDEPETGL